MDLNEIMPVVLFSIPWFMALFEVRRGLRTGRMREYLRSDYTEDNTDRPAKYCHRTREPKTFWCLFAFYVVILMLIPIGIAVALLRRS